MTQPAPLPYMGSTSNEPWSADLSHLRTLAICHYIWGAIVIVLSCMGLIHVTIGFAMAFSAKGSEAAMGVVFMIIGALIIAVGSTIGILNIVSGRGLVQHRYRVLSFVMAGINCSSFPLGTLLGVFTFVVLCRDSVRQMYPSSQKTPTSSIPMASRA